MYYWWYCPKELSEPYSDTMQVVYFILILFPCCYGGSLTYYVQENTNETECVVAVNSSSCRSLSQYVADSNLEFDSDTTLAFLPGTHVLDGPFNITGDKGVTSLFLQPATSGVRTSITCKGRGSFNFQGLQSFIVEHLEFISCSLPEAAPPTYAVFAIGDVLSVTLRYCAIRQNAASMIAATNSTIAFVGNQVTSNSEVWMILYSCTATLAGNVIANNAVTDTGNAGGLSLHNSNLTTLETNTFDTNFGIFGGAIHGLNSMIVLNGTTAFMYNRATVGGALSGASIEVVLAGNVTFESNTAEFGGVLGSYNCRVVITGNVVFRYNDATNGGAFYLVLSTIMFMNRENVTFFQNTATSGGALYLSGGSILTFIPDVPGLVIFEENLAVSLGGAIFIQDTNTLSYCLLHENFRNIAVQECSFQVEGDRVASAYQTRVLMFDNFAGDAGGSLYGGAVDNCILLSNDNPLELSGSELFNKTVYIDSSVQSIDDNSARFVSSGISSDPYIVCTCDDSGQNCTSNFTTRTIYPGATIQVSVIALGQRNGRVPATVLAFPSDLPIEELARAQGVSKYCTNLSYTIYASPGNASMQLFAQGSCLTQGGGLTIQLEVLSCPPGFIETTIAKNKRACMCDSRLTRYTDVCYVQNGTILRDDIFWVGYDSELKGIILNSACPFDYCNTEDISFQVENSDAQCAGKRSGLLCGECSGGLSLVLGSSSCEKCSDDYLALLLFFTAAGVILVAFLLLLNLTVAIGTINGLIFYANIVAANEALVFPSKSNGYLDILKVFIAWINLDFGIKSCFYDGMDQYAKTWLQYVFPVYIWFLIGVVFVASHFSSRAAKALGSNPVAVLATLILLSYTKVLGSIIEAFSSATLDYPQGESRVVWLYDGNVPFLDTSDGRHLGLFIASLLVLLVLFIPYTLLLLTSQWLQIKSHWKVLSWLNKPQLRSFLDAYHAPYKPRHRYWTGLLLLLRLALLITSARTTADNPGVNLYVVQLFVCLVQMWAWINGGIYKKWYLNMIEAFFFLNLCFLMSSIQHIKYQLCSQKLSSDGFRLAQTAATSTLLTTAAVAFIGILGFHVYLRLRGDKRIGSYVAKRSAPDSKIELEQTVSNNGEVMTTSVSLREPLLDS